MKRVLLVEDERNFLRVIALLLTRLGRDVCTVRTGREAVEAVKKEPFDLAIVDQQANDGCSELVSELKSFFPRLPVMALMWPAYEMTGRPDATITKPFNIGRMIEQTENLLNGTGETRRLLKAC